MTHEIISLVSRKSYSNVTLLMSFYGSISYSRSSLMAALQVRVNDVARVICGSSQSDQRTVADLLKSSGLPSVNRLVIKSIAVEA